MRSRTLLIAPSAAFAILCCLAAILPPPGEPRLHYTITFPDDVPPRITLWDIGAREGTMYNGRRHYADLHRDGWEEFLYDLAHPPPASGVSLPGVFSTDLDIPFPCEAYFDADARADGYAECRWAVNELIARYGVDRVRQVLRDVPSRYDRRNAGRRPRSEGIRVTRKAGSRCVPHPSEPHRALRPT